MTKLEEEIFNATRREVADRLESLKFHPIGAMIKESTAQAAAEVVKKYIEKALDDCKSKCGKYFDNNKWLKENGITE